jgi:hypothetical protein
MLFLLMNAYSRVDNNTFVFDANAEKEAEDLSLSALFPYAFDKLSARKQLAVRYRLALKTAPPLSERAPLVNACLWLKALKPSWVCVCAI